MKANQKAVAFTTLIHGKPLGTDGSARITPAAERGLIEPATAVDEEKRDLDLPFEHRPGAEDVLGDVAIDVGHERLLIRSRSRSPSAKANRFYSPAVGARTGS